MPQDNQKLWSCVGSAGVVNLPDIGKIIFNNSVAQLGPGGPVGVTQGVARDTAREVARVLPGTQTVSAVIRYGVVPVEGVYVNNVGLVLRYRGGSGHVQAKLIQVNIESGTETALITFVPGPPGNVFQVQTSLALEVAMDFTANAYYVEITLSATEGLTVPAYPPAIAVVQLNVGIIE